MTAPKQHSRARRLPSALGALAMVALINTVVPASNQQDPTAPAKGALTFGPPADIASATPTAQTTPTPPLPTIALADRPIVGSRARRFLIAFASFDVGRQGPRVRAQLRATATPRLSRALQAHPPRPSGAGYPRAGRVTRLRAFRHADGWQATATLRASGSRRHITITLVDSPDGPRVDAVLP